MNLRVLDRLRASVVQLWSGRIRNRLILGVALVHAVMMTIFILDLVERQRAALREEALISAMGLAERLAVGSTAWMASSDLVGLEEQINLFVGTATLRYAMLVDAKGMVLAHSERQFVGKFLSDPVSQSFLKGKLESRPITQTNQILDVVAPVTLQGVLLGWARVSLDESRTQQALDRVLYEGIAYTIMAIAIGILLAWWMARGMTRSLEQLMRAAQRVGNGEREIHVDTERLDEIGVVSREFKRMVEALADKERQLAQNEQRWVMALDGAGHGVWDWNVRSGKVFYSQHWKRILGYQPEEIGDALTDWQSRIHPDDLAGAMEALNRHVHGVAPFYRNVHRMRDKAGAWHWILDQGMVFERDLRGDALRTVGTITDITEQIGMEASLRESEARIQMASQAGGVGFWDWDLITNDVYYSPEWKRQLGYLDDELPNGYATWERNLHPEDKPRVLQTIEEFMAGKRTNFEVEHRLRHKEGHWVWVLSRGDLFRDEQGKPVRMAGVHLDVTRTKQGEIERVSLQGQLQQAQKMEAVGQLTGGIAHDFNNILAAILGYANLARTRFAGENAKLTDYLGEIVRAGERGRDLVLKMLAYSRGGKGSMQSLALGDLAEDTLKMLRPAMPSGLEIMVQVEPGLPNIAGDPVGLQQVITNLCINARDAMSGQGRLGVRVNRVILHEAQECAACHALASGEFVELAVVDSGEGMAPDQISRIFQPFYTTKEVGKGTGMGLAMVHGIVHEHDGHIRVDSTPGEGTVFHILLPLAAANGVKT